MKPEAAKLEIGRRTLDGGVAVVSLAGRVMLGEESARIESVTAELLGDGVRKIVFDMSGVTHIDSTGIGRFIASFNQVMRAGGRMSMAGASGLVRDGFRVTRLDTVFKFFPDTDSAAAAMR